MPEGQGYPEPDAHRGPQQRQHAAEGSRRRRKSQQAEYAPAPQAAPPPKPKKQRRKRKRPLRRLLTTLFLLWILFLLGTPAIAWMTTNVVDGYESTVGSQPGTAVLLVGSDGRENLSAEDRRRLGTGSTEGRRTDTMMLLYTAPDGKSVILGLPRDSYVEIPGRDKNKLNAAYAFGGAPLLIETVEHNTGIEIDGYVEIGMLGLVDMVDAVGGIEVCPEAPMKDKDAHLDIPAGCQELDGVTALSYARMRKSDPKGDIGRMERQREVIGKVVGRALSPMTLINPVRYWNLNMAAAGTLTRTPETGIPTMFGAGSGLVGSFLGRGVSLSVPISNADARTSAGSSVIWDDERASAVFEAIQRGDVDAVKDYQ